MSIFIIFYEVKKLRSDPYIYINKYDCELEKIHLNFVEYIHTKWIVFRFNQFFEDVRFRFIYACETNFSTTAVRGCIRSYMNQGLYTWNRKKTNHPEVCVCCCLEILQSPHHTWVVAWKIRMMWIFMHEGGHYYYQDWN